MAAKETETKKGQDKRSIAGKRKVIFLDPSISREVPNKKEVLNVTSEKGKTMKQKHIMIKTLKEAFGDFQKQNPREKIGFTSFSKLKPK